MINWHVFLKNAWVFLSEGWYEHLLHQKKSHFPSASPGEIIYTSSWIINFLAYNVSIHYDYLFMWYGHQWMYMVLRKRLISICTRLIRLFRRRNMYIINMMKNQLFVHSIYVIFFNVINITLFLITQSNVYPIF